MKQRLLLAACALFYNALSAQSIIINDFEQGTSSALLNSAQYRVLESPKTFLAQNFSFVNCIVPTVFGNLYTPSSTFNNSNNLASVTYGVSYLLGGTIPITTVGSGGGNYSMRLGNRNPYERLSNPSGFRGARISYTQQFNSQMKFVTYTYLAHFNSPHYTQLDIQPLFTVRLLDINNNIIETSPVLCLKADSADSRLQTQGDFTYMSSWKTGAIIVPDEYIGQNLKIQFVVTDCGQSGHQGVAYIDNIKQTSRLPIGVGLNQQLAFQTGQITCPEENIEVCLGFTAPEGYSLNNLQLNVINQSTSTIVQTLNISTFNNNINGTVCFEIDRDDLPAAGGYYNFSGVATFKTPTGNTHTLSVNSPNQPHLTINSSPFLVTIGADNYIHWPDFGGPYTIEVSRDFSCCPSQSGANGGYITPEVIQITSHDNKEFMLDMLMLTGQKCFRYRIKTPCGWTEWCCLTSYPFGTGYPQGANIGNNYNVDCVIDLNYTAPKPIASPNPTTGNVTILNANSTNFEIYDLSQNKVKTVKTAQVEEKVNIDFSELKPGIYILKLDNNEDIKIIKQ